jgi:hypothetical protein
LVVAELFASIVEAIFAGHHVMVGLTVSGVVQLLVTALQVHDALSRGAVLGQLKLHAGELLEQAST